MKTSTYRKPFTTEIPHLSGGRRAGKTTYLTKSAINYAKDHPESRVCLIGYNAGSTKFLAYKTEELTKFTKGGVAKFPSGLSFGFQNGSVVSCWNRHAWMGHGQQFDKVFIDELPTNDKEAEELLVRTSNLVKDPKKDLFYTQTIYEEKI